MWFKLQVSTIIPSFDNDKQLLFTKDLNILNGYIFLLLILLRGTFIATAASEALLICVFLNFWLSLGYKLFWQFKRQNSSLHNPLTVKHLSFTKTP